MRLASCKKLNPAVYFPALFTDGENTYVTYPNLAGTADRPGIPPETGGFDHTDYAPEPDAGTGGGGRRSDAGAVGAESHGGSLSGNTNEITDYDDYMKPSNVAGSLLVAI